MCGAGRTPACLIHRKQSASRTYVRGRADTCVSRPHSAKRCLQLCAGQGGHMRVSSTESKAPPARMCGARRTRARLAHKTRSVSRTYVRGRGGHVRVSPTRCEALPARMCRGMSGPQWPHITRSTSSTYVLGKADTCVSRPHNAKCFPHICAGQGGHVRVLPTYREVLPAFICGAGRICSCPACMARCASRTYVQGRTDRADTYVSRPHHDSTMRSQHICAGPGGHGRVPPA